jgi:hypothetical protein
VKPARAVAEVGSWAKVVEQAVIAGAIRVRGDAVGVQQEGRVMWVNRRCEVMAILSLPAG